MSYHTDKALAMQAKRGLEPLQRILNVLEIQITVPCDNLPADDDGHREEVKEAGRELLVIARSIQIASTMVGTTQNDF